MKLVCWLQDLGQDDGGLAGGKAAHLGELLRAGLAWWSRRSAEGEVGRSRVAPILSHWRKGADVAGTRDKAAREKLPAEERAACEKLRADVAALLKEAEGKE
jgi:hypothetical protein